MPGRFVSRIPEISKKLSPEMDKALLESADYIKELAKALCPIDEDDETHLQDAIHVEKREESTGRYTEVVAWSKKAWWGFLVEFGHHQKGGPGNHETVGYVPAHPFLVPAAELGRRFAKERGDRAMKDAAG